MKGVAGKIAVAVLSLFLLAYIAYQAISYFYKPYREETIFQYSVQETVQCRGVFIRDEVVLEQEYSGVLNYLHDDASLVSRGMRVADIYGSAHDIQNIQRAQELRDEIAMLEESQDTGSNYYTLSDTIGRRISEKLGEAVILAGSGWVADLPEVKTDLLRLINRRQIIAGTEDDYTGRIAQLETQLAQVESATPQSENSIQSPTNGYFVSCVDGYESILTLDGAENLSVSDYESIVRAAIEEKQGIVGKIIKSYEWYYAALVPADSLGAFSKGIGITLEFGLSGIAPIPGTVFSIIEEPGSDYAVVLIECSYISGELARLRTRSAQIVFRSISGLRVPSKAIRMVDGEQGVFVVDRKTVAYRTIDVVYESAGFVIARWDKTDASSLQLFDQIITEGTDLYVGKQLE